MTFFFSGSNMLNQLWTALKEDKQFVRKLLTLCEPMRKRQLKRLERSIAVDENGKTEPS
jgi:hypothetical protein